MTTLRCGVLVLLCSVLNPWSAHAEDILLDGEAACLAIAGAWSPDTCTVERLVVPAGTRLISDDSVTLVTGDVVIDGSLAILGGFEASGLVANRGTLYTYSFLVTTAPMINRGMWENYGVFRADAEVVNEWLFQNGATFSTGLGRFVNWGYTANIPGAVLSSGGGPIVNEGLLQNFGYLTNGSVLDNFGVVTNYAGTVFNYGRAVGRCGSAWFLADLGPGPGPVGNPIIYEPCQPTGAAAALARTVLELGQRRLFPKDDVVALLKLALKAGKQLAQSHDEEAVALLDGFGAEVSARVASYPFGAALHRRADHVVEMIRARPETP
jgi:hypothetical protein